MKYHRRSVRLKGYDYSDSWYYFVTICLQNREKLFGEIKNNQMILNAIGIDIKKIFIDYFNNIYFRLDEYILMPDHIHMIIVIKNKFNNVGAGLVPALKNEKTGIMNTRVTTNRAGINLRATTRVAPTGNKTLGMIVGELKSLITNEYIRNVKENNWPKFNKRLWQRNYFERVIRNEKEYLKIKKYIKDNPKN